MLEAGGCYIIPCRAVPCRAILICFSCRLFLAPMFSSQVMAPLLRTTVAISLCGGTIYYLPIQSMGWVTIRKLGHHKRPQM